MSRMSLRLQFDSSKLESVHGNYGPGESVHRNSSKGNLWASCGFRRRQTARDCLGGQTQLDSRAPRLRRCWRLTWRLALWSAASACVPQVDSYMHRLEGLDRSLCGFVGEVEMLCSALCWSLVLDSASRRGKMPNCANTAVHHTDVEFTHSTVKHRVRRCVPEDVASETAPSPAVAVQQPVVAPFVKGSRRGSEQVADGQGLGAALASWAALGDALVGPCLVCQRGGAAGWQEPQAAGAA